ncbi:MAG: SMC-Scp complex subunit ScpB [Candidatus Riflebacteria bacterium RBG_13_59_9]|nr:MAG: SMC-Scp complex subunit ScpB [Candidatus Riflebacteria bacterium RBG_13_59_9]
MTDTAASKRIPELVAVLFRAGRVVPAGKLAEHFNCKPHELALAADEANAALNSLGLQISFVAGGYRLTTHAEAYHGVREFFTEIRESALTQQALEVLAIVAYRQPVTRVEVEEIRQVNSESPLHSLLQRRLIKVKGRGEQAGRPFLYVTTGRFLEVFGMASLEDLPKIDLTAAIPVYHPGV